MLNPSGELAPEEVDVGDAVPDAWSILFIVCYRRRMLFHDYYGHRTLNTAISLSSVTSLRERVAPPLCFAS